MSLTLKQTIYGSLAFVLIGCALGFGLGWKLWGQKTKPTMETLAPAYRLADDNLVLGRAPNLHPTLPIPQSDVPKGAVVTRIVKVYVQSNPAAPLPPQTPPTLKPPPCPPVEVDLTLVRLKDNSYRVIASSPNGTIQNNSVDIPVTPDVPPLPVAHNNDVLVSYDPLNKVGGIDYLRHFRRVVAGAGVELVRQTLANGSPTTAAVHVTVGWSF